MVFVVMSVFSDVDQSYQFIFSKEVVHNGGVRSPPVSVPKHLGVVTCSETTQGGGATRAGRAEAGHWRSSGADWDWGQPASRLSISLGLAGGQPWSEWDDVNWVTSGPGGAGHWHSQAGVAPPSDQERDLHGRQAGRCYSAGGERRTVVRCPGETRPSWLCEERGPHTRLAGGAEIRKQ